jgi:hypothetical protein
MDTVQKPITPLRRMTLELLSMFDYIRGSDYRDSIVVHSLQNTGTKQKKCKTNP